MRARRLAALARDLPQVFVPRGLERQFGLKSHELRGPRGIVLTNPSIARLPSGRLVVLAREVSYRIERFTSNYRLLDGYDRRTSAVWAAEIPETLDAAGEDAFVQLKWDRAALLPEEEGIEDARAFFWRGQTWLLASASHASPDGDRQSRMIAGVISDGEITSLRAIKSPEGRSREKNWALAVTGDALDLVHDFGTLAVYRYDGEELRRHTPHSPEVPALRGHFGSSQLLRWRDGWLTVTHTRIDLPVRFPLPYHRYYFHHFVHLDDDYRLVAASEGFFFRERGIEFCAGIAEGDDALLVSYGSHDAEARIVRVPHEVIAQTLRLTPAHDMSAAD